MYEQIYIQSEVCNKEEPLLLVKFDDTFNKNKKLLRYLTIK